MRKINFSLYSLYFVNFSIERIKKMSIIYFCWTIEKRRYEKNFIDINRIEWCRCVIAQISEKKGNNRIDLILVVYTERVCKRLIHKRCSLSLRDSLLCFFANRNHSWKCCGTVFCSSVFTASRELISARETG